MIEVNDAVVTSLRSHLNAKTAAQIAKAALAPHVWEWFLAHEGDTLIKVKKTILIFRPSISIKVGDLRPLVLSIFGPPPLEI